MRQLTHTSFELATYKEMADFLAEVERQVAHRGEPHHGEAGPQAGAACPRQRAAAPRRGQAARPVILSVDFEAFADQQLYEQPRQLIIVVNDQYTHIQNLSRLESAAVKLCNQRQI